jgi:hypothetical protein
LKWLLAFGCWLLAKKNHKMITVTVVFGKESVQKVLNNLPLNANEMEQYQKSYTFETEKEAEAFAKGINEAVGWQEVYVYEAESRVQD